MTENEQAFRVDISAEQALVSKQKQNERALARARAVIAAAKHAEATGMQFTDQDAEYYRGLSKKKAILATKALSHTVKHVKRSRVAEAVEARVNTSDEVASDEMLAIFEEDKVDTEAVIEVVPAPQMDLPVENDDEKSVDPYDVVFSPPPMLVVETPQELDEAIEQQETEELQDVEQPAEVEDASAEVTDTTLSETAIQFLKDVGMYEDTYTTNDIPDIAQELAAKFTKLKSKLDYRKMFELYLSGVARGEIAAQIGSASGRSVNLTIYNIRVAAKNALKKDSEPAVEVEAQEVPVVLSPAIPLPRPPVQKLTVKPFPKAIVDEEVDAYFAENSTEATDTQDGLATEIEAEVADDVFDKPAREQFQNELTEAQDSLKKALSRPGLVSHGEWLGAIQTVFGALGPESGLTADETRSLVNNMRRDPDVGYGPIDDATHAALEKLQPHVIPFLREKSSSDLSRTIVLKAAVLKLDEIQSFDEVFAALKRRSHNMTNSEIERTIILAFSELLQSIVKEQ